MIRVPKENEQNHLPAHEPRPSEGRLGTASRISSAKTMGTAPCEEPATWRGQAKTRRPFNWRGLLIYLFIQKKSGFTTEQSLLSFPGYCWTERGPYFGRCPSLCPKPALPSAPGAAGTEKPLEGARSRIASHSSPIIFKQAHFICWQHMLRVETKQKL